MAAAAGAAMMVGAMLMFYLKQYKKQTHYGAPCVEGGYRRVTCVLQAHVLHYGWELQQPAESDAGCLGSAV
jgi:hypothetical protein